MSRDRGPTSSADGCTTEPSARRPARDPAPASCSMPLARWPPAASISLKSCGLEACVERDLLGDLALHHVAEQRLVEGAHAVVLALGDHFGDLAGFLGVEDQVLDPAGDDQDLGGGHPAVAGDVGDEPLGDRALQGRGEHHPGLVLEAGREEVDDPVDRLGRVEGVDGGEDEVAGLGRRERGADRLLVAHLADQDHVGVLAQDAPHRAAEALGVGADLALVDDRAFVFVQVLDRVLEGDDVMRPGCG